MKDIKIGIIIGILAIWTTVILVCSGIVVYKIFISEKNKPTVQEEQMTEMEEESETEESQEETQEAITEETVMEETTESVTYPEPEYVFQKEEIEIPISGLDREYRIAWVSDVHMINDLQAAEDVMEDQIETIKLRDELLFRTQDGVPSRELWPEIVKYLNYNQFDAIIFGGDMMDYCSQKNVDYMLQYYEQLNPDVPMMYIRADHDYGFWYGGDVFKEVDAWNTHMERFQDHDELEQKVLYFDKFIILGINKSTKDMESWYLDWVKSYFELAQKTEREVIIATHVPYASQVDGTLEALSFEVRNKVYYWGGGNYVPNEITSQFMNLIYDESTIVKQVIAGHLHAKWDGMITSQVRQHIFTPSYLGYIGIIHVVPAE